MAASQAAMYKMLSGGVGDLTTACGDHQLCMWICINVFENFMALPRSNPTNSYPSMSPAEEDVAHYIGGFVCHKLTNRNPMPRYQEVVQSLISGSPPEAGTLVEAKSRGKLTNLTRDGQFVFVELENVFRSVVSPSATNVCSKTYRDACLANDVVQDCFSSATRDIVCSSFNERVLSDIIFLYFKVRVNHRCKCVMEKVRTKPDMKKEKSLRSKLSK